MCRRQQDATIALGWVYFCTGSAFEFVKDFLLIGK